MIERYLEQTVFHSQEEFRKNFKLKIPHEFNFAYDVVDVWAEEEPNKKALLWTNEKGDVRQFTFADMKRYSDMTAAYFQQLGIGRGDMVMLILKRRYEFWFCMLALHKIGAVAVPATHLLSSGDISYRCRAADIHTIVCVEDEQIPEKVKRASEEAPSLQHLICVGDTGVPGFEDFYAGIHAAPPFKRPDCVNKNEDISLMFFTSGTSAHPKMVAHDFVYPLAHIITAKYWHNLTEESLHLTIADTGWGKAVWGKLYGQWIVGANVFVYDHNRFTIRDILRKIQDFKVTSLCAPPTVFRFLVHEDLGQYDLSSLKYCTIAGEALNPSVFETFKKRTGLQLMEAYGQTESTILIGTMPWMQSKPGSMGLPSPLYDIDLIDAEGNPITTPGEVGEVVVRTEHGRPVGLFKEYYRDPELTNKMWKDKFYHTCDMAYRDEDGYFWFIGRADDVIKSSGYRVGPFEVENALMMHPAVCECAVTGVPDEDRGQIVKATIVPTQSYKHKVGKHLARELQMHVKKVTAPYKYPRLIEFVEELPKTISGKIRRVEIRERDRS